MKPFRRFAFVAVLLAAAAVTRAAADGYTPAKYDLSALPPYQPEQMALGVVRIYGTPLESLVGAGRRRFAPSRATCG